jgi:hypothetical protein
VPALPPYIIEPIFEQFLALLPDRVVHHPLGCHKPRIPDRVILEKLVQILVFGCAYRRIAEEGCSATAIRNRRDEWIELGVMEALRQIALSAYDRLIGLELEEVAVDGCITKAPCGGDKAGKSPVDRGKQGTKRSTAVDGKGIPLVHRQDRLCGMSYGSRHETSNLRTCVVPRGAQGFGSRAALQRRLCSASKPDSSGKFAWRVPAQDRSEFGMRLPDGQERHPRLRREGPGCS